MNSNVEGIEKITRDQVAHYLKTGTTSGQTPTDVWSLIGVGITSYGIAYNPQVTTEKWIIHKAATSSLDSYQRQGDISQKCYKGDPVFEYVNELRRTAGIGADVQTKVLDIDTYDETTTGTYKATRNNAIIVITNYMAEDAVIEYTIYYNGDPEQGTVTFTNGQPVFTVTV